MYRLWINIDEATIDQLRTFCKQQNIYTDSDSIYKIKQTIRLEHGRPITHISIKVYD